LRRFTLGIHWIAVFLGGFPAWSADSIQREIADSRRNAIVQAIERVSPSVVSVNTTSFEEYAIQHRHPVLDFLRYFPEEVPGIGSGFIIREDGYILTNHHVVEGARDVAVTFSDGRTYNVTDVRRDVLVDRQMDLAVIRIDAKHLPVVKFGDSNEVIIGEWAITIGNPFGLLIEDPKPTVTVGVISAVDRNFRPDDGGHIYQGMIQTDASINPGNSGGPLVNSSGEVIGVNTFILSKSGDASGIGFAIPINRAVQIARNLIDSGTQEFWTGFWLHPNLTPWFAHAVGLSIHSGALITRIEENSPASRAGLSPGDLIVKVNGRRVTSDKEVVGAFRSGRVGEVFNLKVLRGRILRNADLLLEEDPGVQ
jgi:serine protease Do